MEKRRLRHPCGLRVCEECDGGTCSKCSVGRPPHIRWMIRRDMPEVLAIETESFAHPWSEEEFAKTLRQRNCIGMVVLRGPLVVGYMIYGLNKCYLEVLNFAVDAGYRRERIATAMVEKLKGKLSSERRYRLTLCVMDANLDAQLFFRAGGFECVGVERDHFDEWCPGDAYRMEFVLPAMRATEKTQ